MRRYRARPLAWTSPPQAKGLGLSVLFWGQGLGFGGFRVKGLGFIRFGNFEVPFLGERGVPFVVQTIIVLFSLVLYGAM